LLGLRARNDERLLALGVQAREVAALIDSGRQAFDIVDEFAESTWSDIRGNGSEAEASAGEATRLWARAAASNTIEQQAFAAAHEDLNAVEAQLARAASLAEAILGRLKDLEHARAIAKDELAAAAADVAAGQEYLASHDPDVGKAPEQQLHQAAELLAQAQAEAAKPKPDWLALVRQAQAANSAADAALAGARSEVEAMDKIRAQAQRAQQLAASEVQRAERFRETHRSDIGWDSIDMLQRLQEQLRAAQSALRQAESLAEDERRAALERARSQFASIDSEADRVYSRLYAAFQRAEAARQAAEEERRRSSSSSSSSWSSSSSSSSSGGGGSWGSGSSSGGSWGSGSSSGGGW
jgi:septal ring factor EnvC (AmiA/AmiB activator)